MIGEDGISGFESGRFTFFVGGQQPDQLSEELTGKKVLAKDYYS